jgi:hypothetical protein
MIWCSSCDCKYQCASEQLDGGNIYFAFYNKVCPKQGRRWIKGYSGLCSLVPHRGALGLSIYTACRYTTMLPHLLTSSEQTGFLVTLLVCVWSYLIHITAMLLSILTEVFSAFHLCVQVNSKTELWSRLQSSLYRFFTHQCSLSYSLTWHCVTHAGELQVTPYSIALEKLIVMQQTKKFPASCGTWRFLPGPQECTTELYWNWWI